MQPTRHQKEVIDSVRGIFVVDAGPGTGKTFSITKRYLRILEEEGVTTSDILLLTFTRNAAEQMKERIVNALLDNDCACNVLDTDISTFHSFCNTILGTDPSHVPSYLGMDCALPRNYTVIEDPVRERRIFFDAFSKVKRDSGERYKDIFTIIGTRWEQVHSLVNKLFTRGLLPDSAGWLFDADSKLNGDRDEFLRRASMLNVPGVGKKGNAVQSPLLKACKGNGAKKSFFMEPDGLYEGKCVSESGIKGAFDDDRELLKSFVHDVAYEFIGTCVRGGSLTFTLLVAFSFLQLYNDADLRQRLAYKFVMVDEFQDTNRLQLMLIALLMKESNLCVVGDWKQGIYGFRNATIDNILQFEETFGEIVGSLKGSGKNVTFAIDPTHLEFVDNYRSSQDIIDLFSHALYIEAKKEDVVDVGLLDSAITRLSSQMDYGENTSIRSLCTRSEKEEISAILQAISSMTSTDNCMVAHDGSYMRAKYSDIAILTRTREFALKLQEAAMTSGIPLTFDGGIELFSTHEGILLYAWLRILSNPCDKKGWTAILENEEIAPMDIRRMVRSMDIPQHLGDLRTALTRRSNSIVSLCAGIFDYYDIDTSYSRALVDKMSSVVASHPLSIRGVVGYIEDAIAHKDTDQVTISSSGDSVTVQTIHGSKGLEYPIVVLAHCDRGVFPSYTSDYDVITFDEAAGLRITKIVEDVGGHKEIFDSWRTSLVKKVSRESYDEERRLLFVALSRAKQHILITSSSSSPFFRGLEGMCEPMNVSAQSCLVACYTGNGPACVPAMPETDAVVVSVPVHDIMGKIRDAGGHGIAYGVAVHRMAEDMALGYDADRDYPEKEAISDILSTLEGARLLAEVPCCLPLGGITAHGAIDLLALYDNRFVIIDYKTDMDAEANLDAYRIQLSVYYHAVKKVYGIEGVVRIAYVSAGNIRDVEPYTLDELCSRVSDVSATHL